MLSDIRSRLLSWQCCCLTYSAKEDMGMPSRVTERHPLCSTFAVQRWGAAAMRIFGSRCSSRFVLQNDGAQLPGRQPVLSPSFGRCCCDTSLVICDPENTASQQQAWTTRACKHAAKEQSFSRKPIRDGDYFSQGGSRVEILLLEYISPFTTSVFYSIFGGFLASGPKLHCVLTPCSITLGHFCCFLSGSWTGWT